MLNRSFFQFKKMNILEQGSQTQIDPRATFQRKNPPRAAVLRGPQTTINALKIS